MSLAFGICYSERISTTVRTVTFQNACDAIRELVALTTAQCFCSIFLPRHSLNFSKLRTSDFVLLFDFEKCS